MISTISHAPSANFATAKITVTIAVETAPKPLMTALVPPAWLPFAQPVPHHAGLRQGDRGEDADRVERDEGIDLSAERDEHDDRDDGQDDDAGAERQALAAEGEAAGHEAVAREDRRQPREVGEARVGGQDQDAGRGQLEEVVDRARAVDGAADLGDDGFAICRRNGADNPGQVGKPEEHHGHEDAHDGQRRAGVLPLRRLKAGTPLDTASTPVMALQPSAKARISSSSRVTRPPACRHDPGHVRRVAEQRSAHADGDQRQRRDQEHVGRDREDRAALADAAQVDQHHEHDRDDAKRHAVGATSGNAEMIATMPAATLTDTVRT